MFAPRTANPQFIGLDSESISLFFPLLVSVAEKILAHLQIGAVPQEGIESYPNGRKLMEDALKMGADCVGAIPHFEFTREYSVSSLNYAMELAEKLKKNRFTLSDYLEQLESMGIQDGDTVSLYRCGDFLDLCRGPHIPSTGAVKAFTLLSVAGAYWRGDEKRPMLSRIYGTAFGDEKALKEHLNALE